MVPILLSSCLLRKLFDTRHYYHPLGRPPPLAQNKFKFWHLLVTATFNVCPFSSKQTHRHHVQNFWDSSNNTKLAMLTAWTSSQPSSNVIMDYAPGSIPICFGTGASSCISNNISDFISLENYNSTVQGIGSGLSIKGKGTLQWFLLDNSGQEMTLFVKDALHVPQVPMNLLYP